MMINDVHQGIQKRKARKRVGRGPGSGSRASMAKVIIGGQTLCLLLTLLMTPVAYSLFDDLGRLRLGTRLRSGVVALVGRVRPSNGRHPA